MGVNRDRTKGNLIPPEKGLKREGMELDARVEGKRGPALETEGLQEGCRARTFSRTSSQGASAVKGNKVRDRAKGTRRGGRIKEGIVKPKGVLDAA